MVKMPIQYTTHRKKDTAHKQFEKLIRKWRRMDENHVWVRNNVFYQVDFTVWYPDGTLVLIDRFKKDRLDYEE